MFTKKHNSYFKFVTVVFVLLSLSWILMLSNKLTARAEENVEPYGIYTKIDLSVISDNSQIIAIANNKFTLGNSKIIVNLYLYSSETYMVDCSLMKFESHSNISDLDQGESLEVRAAINGRQLYWRAVMRYKFDDRDWVEKQTDTFLFDANGNII